MLGRLGFSSTEATRNNISFKQGRKDILMKRFFPFLCAMAMIAVSAAQNTPTITGTLDGSRTIVFETQVDSCSPNDIPDAMARAFRDYTGTVHFVTASSEMYQSLGPSLDSLVHNCTPAFKSFNDANPADYNDQIWLDSFYTFDGKRIAALSHTEYHGWAHSGECHTQNFNECEYDSDTYHQSSDGGYHFKSFAVPNNLVAEVPFKYEIDRGPIGYSVDSNIVEYGGWYYAIVTNDGNWPPNCTPGPGPNRCLMLSGAAPMRTKDVFNPSSWRGWNGTDFSLTFVDPYLGTVEHPEQHVYPPVQNLNAVNGLNVYQSANVVVATLWDYWDNEYGPPGMYLTTSTDLVNWTKPTLVVTLAQITADDPPGNWLYAYFSLIDPDAPDMSFSIVGDHPYLYYVRLNNDPPYGRVVYRQKLTLLANP
jgi:hypothetical protein